jgi:hypothetical protein
VIGDVVFHTPKKGAFGFEFGGVVEKGFVFDGVVEKGSVPGLEKLT